MKIEELQASLEVHELKMNERSPVKPQYQALYALKQKQGGKNKKWRGNIKWQSNKHKGKNSSFQGKHDHTDSNQDQSVSYGRKREPGSSNKGGKGKFDHSKIRCYSCQGWENFANECGSADEREKKKKYSKNEAHMAQAKQQDDSESNSDGEAIVLMTTTCNFSSNGDSKTWYLDTGFSNHMTCNLSWLVSLDDSKKLM